MDHLNMDSANRRHAQSLAVERERIALSKWETQMRQNLSMMEFEALQAERAKGWDFAYAELAQKYPDLGSGGGINSDIAFEDAYTGYSGIGSGNSPTGSKPAPYRWLDLF